MSQFSPLQQMQLQQVAKKALQDQTKAILMQKNKDAAKEQLLRMQVMLTRMSTK